MHLLLVDKSGRFISQSSLLKKIYKIQFIRSTTINIYIYIYICVEFLNVIMATFWLFFKWNKVKNAVKQISCSFFLLDRKHFTLLIKVLFYLF